MPKQWNTRSREDGHIAKPSTSKKNKSLFKPSTSKTKKKQYHVGKLVKVKLFPCETTQVTKSRIALVVAQNDKPFKSIIVAKITSQDHPDALPRIAITNDTSAKNSKEVIYTKRKIKSDPSWIHCAELYTFDLQGKLRDGSKNITVLDKSKISKEQFEIIRAMIRNEVFGGKCEISKQTKKMVASTIQKDLTTQAGIVFFCSYILIGLIATIFYTFVYYTIYH